MPTAYHYRQFTSPHPQKYRPGDQSLPQTFQLHTQSSISQFDPFILSIIASGKSKGVDIKSIEFFKAGRRGGLCPEAQAVHRSLGRIKKWLMMDSRLLGNQHLNEGVKQCFAASPHVVYKLE
jgi:hypothetical protein